MPDLAIVILNYNTRDLLASCLKSIQSFAADSQVIVVDNASQDHSVEMVQRDFPNTALVANVANLGFARGINAGIRLATAPHVLALNADTKLLPTTIPPLLETIAKFPRAGIVGAVQCLPDSSDSTQPGVPLATAFSDPTLMREALRLLFLRDALAARLKQGSWKNVSGVPRAVDYLLGAALLFRRECFDQLHGFDEAQFMYGEDWDICYRARQLGWQVYLVPEAKIIHYENSAAKREFGSTRPARVLEGNLYFHRKHFGKLSGSVLVWMYFVGSILRLALLFSLRFRPPSTVQEQREGLRAAWREIWKRSMQ